MPNGVKVIMWDIHTYVIRKGRKVEGKRVITGIQIWTT